MDGENRPLLPEGDAQVLRGVALGDQPLQEVHRRVGVVAALGQDHNRLAREILDDVQQTEHAPSAV